MYTEKLFENIYRIGVPLKGNPLKELNAYFIKGKDFDLLIDTGFRTKDCEAALKAGLEELHSDPKRRHLAITHLHSDHSAMADIFVGEGCPIYMSKEDCDWQNYYYHHLELLDMTKNPAYIARGFSFEMLAELDRSSPSRIFRMQHYDSLHFEKMRTEDTINLGDRILTWITVPGHTPGNSMLWDEEHQIMFTGDHVLFDITPNITDWKDLPNSLGAYINSLKKSLEYPVLHALPGHRKTGDYHARINEILKHHEERIQNAEDIIRQNPNMTALEIAGRMQWSIRARNWEEFPLIQKHFAAGEAQSHIDYLICQGRVTKYKDGLVWRYKVTE